MKILCSYCSAAKRTDPGPLPAIERYRSDRLHELHRRGLADGTPLRILSGEFGLIGPESPLPWYDHLLRPEEAAALSRRVAATLRASGVTAVAYHTADPTAAPAVRPYHDVIEAACRDADVSLEIVMLPGDPA